MRNVAVIAGGPSSEHEVSLWSGRRVFESLDRRRFRPSFVLIEPDGSWSIDGTTRGGPLEATAALRANGCEAVFLALHGPFGEDGTIQGFFETVGLPYTGAGVAGSALAADKVRTKRLVAEAGITVAPDLLLPPAHPNQIEAELGYPVFVKEPRGGSSLEVVRVRDQAELREAIPRLRRGDAPLLLEAAVEGRELTVAILDDAAGEPVPLPVAEICSDGSFFDFRNKYENGVAEEIVPAPVEPTVARRVQQLALRTHRLLGLRAMSRTDFILRRDGTPVFLEINTIPGLTPTSLLPKAAAAAGIPFADVLTRLLEAVLPSAARTRGAKLPARSS